MPMIFEEGYVYGLTHEEISLKWQNLKENDNFFFTSKQTWDYNCVMWSLNINDDWKDFFYAEDGFINKDQSVYPYVEFYTSHGFEKCDTSDLEPTAIKICIYSRNGRFSHVSRQMSDGRWASKMGEYEDIEHNSELDISGTGYGAPEVYMKKNVGV